MNSPGKNGPWMSQNAWPSMQAWYEDEGCGLADWIVVNLMMFELTGETRYIDHAELTLVNHFFMNQFNTRGFGHLAFTQEIVGGKGWQGWDRKFGSENPGCCSLWGQWGLGQAGRFIITQNTDTLYVNLYPSADIEIPDKSSHLTIKSDFPRMSQAAIKLRTGKPIRYDLALRKPAWAESMEILVNSEKITPCEEGGYLHINKRWKGTTEIQIRFISGHRIVPWPAGKPVGVALYDGPLCLGMPADNSSSDVIWSKLEPVGSRWLTHQVKEPVKMRILFHSTPVTR
ncbi:MAG: glycoside hydrolase family 127 protein [Bacteroidia bacterium]|nr:glycoside hydrolase family 127 protein [Bacteroidia bacterium]